MSNFFSRLRSDWGDYMFHFPIFMSILQEALSDTIFSYVKGVILFVERVNFCFLGLKVKFFDHFDITPLPRI
jgi:hypothetical protein